MKSLRVEAIPVTLGDYWHSYISLFCWTAKFMCRCHPLVNKAHKDRDRPDHSKGSMGPRIICPQLVTASPVKLYTVEIHNQDHQLCRPCLICITGSYFIWSFLKERNKNFYMPLLLWLAQRSSSCKTTGGTVSRSQRRLSNVTTKTEGWHISICLPIEWLN